MERKTHVASQDALGQGSPVADPAAGQDLVRRADIAFSSSLVFMTAGVRLRFKSIDIDRPQPLASFREDAIAAIVRLISRLMDHAVSTKGFYHTETCAAVSTSLKLVVYDITVNHVRLECEVQGILNMSPASQQEIFNAYPGLQQSVTSGAAYYAYAGQDLRRIGNDFVTAIKYSHVNQDGQVTLKVGTLQGSENPEIQELCPPLYAYAY